eukprot:TRINITY_DN2507_c0_g1_i1.p1 TRINITY_DN2507_c0_g1~~TRINITY_DN2507_c0_g1_i1.p1  ORF type:complete len:636 (+),score=180.53 TRINITY_DN2507_c0_g1_i1:65-1972(+)
MRFVTSSLWLLAGLAAAGSGSVGTIQFHYSFGVSSSVESLKLDGDVYTDLIMSNMIAGVMLGHLIQGFSPEVQFNKDYVYGTVFGQLLQENLETPLYHGASRGIDPDPSQAAVFGVGQGGPYQINSYAFDFFSDDGFGLVNYDAIRKKIGFTIAEKSTQPSKPTPLSFNDTFYGPMLAAYFHFNDYIGIQFTGTDFTATWTPSQHTYTPVAMEPCFYESMNVFKQLKNAPLDILLNIAYNAGAYSSLFTTACNAATSESTSFDNVLGSPISPWGADSYHQYPYQVRSYLDQLYGKPTQSFSDRNKVISNSGNHVIFQMSSLQSVFVNVFATLSRKNPQSGELEFISNAVASQAFTNALASTGLASESSLELSKTAERDQIFSLLEKAIVNLENLLKMSFAQRTKKDGSPASAFGFSSSSSLIAKPSLADTGYSSCTVECPGEGCDIADNAKLFPDPFAWYTNPSYPGVTLFGPDHQKACGWVVGENFVWNSTANQCILNGGGYPIDTDAGLCANGVYSLSKADFQDKLDFWQKILKPKAKTVEVDGSTVYLVNVDGVEAAMSIGHGVLGGKCGDCFLIKFGDQHVVQLQTDVRAWSLELSTGANIWLAPGNYGGGCRIPLVKQVDCAAVSASFTA